MSVTDRPTKRLGYDDTIVAERIEMRPGDTIGWVYGTDRFGTELRIGGDWRMIAAIEEALKYEDGPVVVEVPDFGVQVIKAVYVPIDWKDGDPT